MKRKGPLQDASLPETRALRAGTLDVSATPPVTPWHVAANAHIGGAVIGWACGLGVGVVP